MSNVVTKLQLNYASDGVTDKLKERNEREREID